MDNITYYILAALASVIILTVHEYSHGYAAYKLGDDTAKQLGRLTLNPIRHIDPIGALCMLLFRFGWAKPVPINPMRLRRPKRDLAIVAAAGPIINLILSFLSGAVVILLYRIVIMSITTSVLIGNILTVTYNFFLIFHVLNLGIAIFNLIPIPPLDGSRILGLIIPDRLYVRILRHERTIYLVFICWLLAGSLVSRFLLSIPVIAKNTVLCEIIDWITLSGFIGKIVDFLSSAILSFWKLIF